jgi:putative ABC transport system permease protein
LPAAGLVLHPSTAAITLIVGITATVVAGLVPAWRSSGVAPMAALRDLAIDTTNASRLRLAAGAVLTAAGAALVVSGSSGDGVLLRVGLGSVATFVGVVVLGPAVATVTTRVLGWPLAWLRGSSGRLAQQNAARNPRRTSGTAAALMIGVGVVTLFTVFASSISSSVETSIDRSFGGDLVVSSKAVGGDTGFSPQLATDAAANQDVTTVVGIGSVRADVGGSQTGIAVSDPAALTKVLDLGATTGSVAGLRDDQLAVSTKHAQDEHWSIGSAVPVTYADHTTQTFTVGALYEVADVIGDVVMARAAWAPHGVQDTDVAVLVKLRDGVSIATGKTDLAAIAAHYPGTQVRTRDEYVASVAAGVNQSLAVIYVMLALAILIALMGIANTLSLSIHERTRELGLLRAVGQSRRQVRAMIRGESAIIALFGTIGGVALGVFLGWSLVRASASEGIGTFNPATGSLVVVCLVGALAGVAAAIRPARRASRLEVLDAIATT